MIRLQGLSRSYSTPRGTVTAVDDLTLEVADGETCVLLGPSGCGKTTTLRMINRLVVPTSGKIFIAGRDTDGVDPVELRRGIGYVIQQIGLFPNMTVAENIGVVPRLLGWNTGRSRRRAEELLALLALEPVQFLDRYPNELSGGQAQRIGVARALAVDPPVLLMDEALAARRGASAPCPRIRGDFRGPRSYAEAPAPDPRARSDGSHPWRRCGRPRGIRRRRPAPRRHAVP